MIKIFLITINIILQKNFKRVNLIETQLRKYF